MNKRSRIIIELESFYIISSIIGLITSVIILMILNKNIFRLVYILSGTTSIFVLLLSGLKIRVKKFEIKNGVIYKKRIPGEKESLEIDKINSIERVGFLNWINKKYNILIIPKTFRKVEIQSDEGTKGHFHREKMVVPESFYEKIEKKVISNKI